MATLSAPAIYNLIAHMLWPHGQILLDGSGVVIFLAVLVSSSRRGRASSALVRVARADS